MDCFWQGVLLHNVTARGSVTASREKLGDIEPFFPREHMHEFHPLGESGKFGQSQGDFGRSLSKVSS